MITTQEAKKQFLAWFALVIGVGLFVLAISSCGHPVCSEKITPGAVLNLGNLEVIQCPKGEYIQSVEPKTIPGGIVTHLIVQCVSVDKVCR